MSLNCGFLRTSPPAAFRLRWLATALLALVPLVDLRAQSNYATPYTFGTLAGSPGLSGSTDGTGSAARFGLAAAGVAADRAGNVYVADTQNHTIRKIAAGGAVTTLAGTAGLTGSTDGTGAAARFNSPHGIAVDSAGNVFVADTDNHTIRKITAAGVVTTFAGSAGISGTTDATGSAARFFHPIDLAIDSAGTLYVADFDNHTIRKITSAGVVTTLAGSGINAYANGTGTSASIGNPQAVAVDGSGTVYVIGLGSNTVRKITSAGVVTDWVGPGVTQAPGSADGTGSSARFFNANGLAADSAGNLYVADTSNQTIRKVASDGTVTTLAGLTVTTGSADGAGSVARFNYPMDVAVDQAGNLYVVDGNSRTVRWGVPAVPALTSLTLAAGNVAEPFRYQVVFSGARGGFTATGLPPGLSIDASTGVISGTPTAEGPYGVLLGTTNPAGAGLGALNLTIGPPYMFATLAGAVDQAGSTDGIGSAARFYYPYGLALDSAGNVYVADLQGSTIRKIARSGQVSTLAGSAGQIGTTDGTGPNARFSLPHGVAADAAGNVYVTEPGPSKVRKITSDGVVTTLAGGSGFGLLDGVGTAARFLSPTGVAVDSAGNVYVADSGNHAIRKITSGGVVTTLAGSGVAGYADGTGNAAQFNNPRGLAVDASGNVYVGEAGNHRIRKVTSAGVVTTLAGSGISGTADGFGVAAEFDWPEWLAVDAEGTLYVAEPQVQTIRKVTASGMVTTVAGAANNPGSSNGAGAGALFFFPRGIAVDPTGGLYVADSINCTIRWGATTAPTFTSANSARGTLTASFSYQVTFAGARTGFTASGLPAGLTFNATTGVISGTPTVAGTFLVALGASNPAGSGTAYLSLTVDPAYTFSTLAGAAEDPGSVDGVRGNARFQDPMGVAVDSAGNVYVADSSNNVVRKIASGGVVTTLAGLAGASGSTDGTGSSARFVGPRNVAVDSAGNVYVTDYLNHRVRKITSGGVVTTLAGAGVAGLVNATGTAARFRNPSGVAVDGAGNVYVADSNNHVIRKVTSAGVVTTFAGSGSPGYADGTGAAASFYLPVGLAVDSAGNLYVGDVGNLRLRKITSGGVVTTLAGSGTAGVADGTGAAAQFTSLDGLAVDGAGNVYVVDGELNVIRKVTSGGTVATMAGTAGLFGSTDGVGTGAQFNSPRGIAVDTAGNLYVGDTTNHTIRWGALAVPTLSSAPTARVRFGRAFNYTVTFARALNGFTITGLPPGLSFNPATGVLSGTPTTPGNYAIQFQATNGAGSSASTSLTLRVLEAGADYNVDDYTDILWENTTSGQRAFWLLNGTTQPSWLSLGQLPSAWRMAAVADISGDGKPDIVWENTSTGDHYVWIMNGPVYNSGANLPTLPLAWRLVGSGDFNGDGDADLVWENTSTGDRSVWYMDGTTNTGSASLGNVPVAWHIAAVADFNADTKPDLLWENTSTGERAIWTMNGVAGTGSYSLGTLPTEWRMIAAADFNADNKTDILWFNGTTGELGCWIMNGTSYSDWLGLGLLPLDWNLAPVCVGDFNTDGRTDILWQNLTTGDRGLWMMHGSPFPLWVFIGTVPTVWHLAGSADLTNDGQRDLVWENTSTGDRVVWSLNGTTQTGTLSLATLTPAWKMAAFADFNADAKPDILWQNSSTGDRVIWYMNGLTNTGSAGLGGIPVAWNIAAAADFNGDGKPDILWQNTTTGDIGIWLMDGANYLGWAGLGTIDPVWRMAGAADYNNDGQTDILWEHTVTGERGYWIMNGSTNTGWFQIGVVPPAWKSGN